jgi:hypothetical protein
VRKRRRRRRRTQSLEQSSAEQLGEEKMHWQAADGD